MPHQEDWQQWTALNQQLLQQWKTLLAASPLSPPPLPAPGAEHPLHLFAQFADDVLAVFETGRGCTWLSPNWERLTGRTVAQSLRAGFYDCLHPEDVKSFTTALQQAVCEDHAQLSLVPPQFRLCPVGKAPRWHALKIGEVRPAAGGAQTIVCCLKDVHEQVEAHAAAREAKRETQAALQTRAEFLNAMSHELRTPLNAILGFTQIMESGMFGPVRHPQYLEYLGYIRESGYELLSQIDEVMELAAVGSGSATPRRDTCRLSELLLQVAALHKPQAKALRMDLRCEAAPALEVVVDRTRLQHCISHIVANALRFGRPAGCVTLGAHLNAGGELCIAVNDNGIGMSARKLQTLVAALQQDDSWETRNANGLGLGLALSNEYARMHGGYLTLESKAGQGTRVTLHLPPECMPKRAQTGKVLRYAAAG